MTVRLVDVAKLAGVSPMTVSRVVHDHPHVSPRKAAAVHDAIARLGYVENHNARALTSKRSHLIGLVSPVFAGEWVAETARPVFSHFSAAGYKVLQGVTKHSKEEEQDVIRSFLQMRADGLIVIGTQHAKRTRDQLKTAGVPVVECWDHKRAALGPVVGFSNLDAGRAITRHMINRGRQDIAMFGDTRRVPRAEQRLKGYLAEMQRAGLPPRVIRLAGYYGYGDESFYRIGETCFEIASRGTHLPDALIMMNDELAAGAIYGAKAAGVGVPRDLLISGYGDTEIARIFSPSITTIRVPWAQIGERAARRLHDRIENPDAPASGFEDVGFELVSRESTAV